LTQSAWVRGHPELFSPNWKAFDEAYDPLGFDEFMTTRSLRSFSRVLAVAALVTSCATVDERAVTDAGATDVPIDFFNATGFDQRMSSALRTKPTTVTVNLLARTTLNDLPERLGVWLSEVEKHHGKVELQDDSEVKTRGIVDLSLAVAGIVMLYKLVENKMMYGPVGDYNATIHYKEGGTVTRVVFTRKDTTPAASKGDARWQ
jgi:hypothetical protein